MFTLPDGDSQFTGGYAFSQSISIGVSTGETSAVRPIGVMDVTTLEIRFYHDLNADGTLDAGDLPFPGATAEILDAQDKVLLTVTSDNDGIARFPVLRGGEIASAAPCPMVRYSPSQAVKTTLYPWPRKTPSPWNARCPTARPAHYMPASPCPRRLPARCSWIKTYRA